jgi:hypothetical protein
MVVAKQDTKAEWELGMPPVPTNKRKSILWWRIQEINTFIPWAMTQVIVVT